MAYEINRDASIGNETIDATKFDFIGHEAHFIRFYNPKGQGGTETVAVRRVLDVVRIDKVETQTK